MMSLYKLSIASILPNGESYNCEAVITLSQTTIVGDAIISNTPPTTITFIDGKTEITLMYNATLGEGTYYTLRLYSIEARTVSTVRKLIGTYVFVMPARDCDIVDVITVVPTKPEPMEAAKVYASEAKAAAAAADTAKQGADTAKAAAEVAQGKAEKAVVGADKAKADTETAKTAAETAQGKAETAASDAGKAKDEAKTAKQGAETAKKAAETAKADAETAKDGAETAKAAAEDAKSEAETAKTEAKTAATDAETFATKTNEALEIATNFVDKGLLWLKDSAPLVQFYPVPESELDVKVHFEPVETLPEEGEKGPENPSVISGWDKIEVTRCGKNLLNIHTREPLPPHVTIVNNTIKIALSTQSFLHNNFTVAPLNTQVTLSALRNQEYEGRIYGFYGYSAYNYSWINNALTRTMTTSGDGRWCEGDDKNSLYVLQQMPQTPISAYFDGTLELSNIQIEVGSVATPYEPYNGDTYTIDLPSTFYGGYVDFEKGVLVQEYVKDSVDNIQYYNGNEVLGYATYARAAGRTAPLIMPAFTDTMKYWVHEDSSCFALRIVDMSSQDDVDAWLDGIGGFVDIYYKLATPIEHPLTDLPTLKTLPQTDRYTPQINTIFANTNGNVEVGYAKSPIKTYNDITNAILAVGGTSV